MIQEAIKYLESGISIIPTDTKTKQPYFSKLPVDPKRNKASWKIFQSELPTKEQAQSWFNSSDVGLAIVLGPVSDNMELLDFDNHLHNAKPIFKDFCKSVKSFSAELFEKLVIQSTQSNGYHVIYRCEEIEGNQKLATQSDNLGNKKCVIETRGEGGYALSYPTKGYKLLKNSIDQVQLITSDERDFIINLCRSFNTADVKEKTVPYTAPRNGKARPGDDYNEKADIKSLLISHGWKLVSNEGKKQMWRRPGKNHGGPSATFNFEGIDKLYVFSSNAAPFEAGTSYDKFAIYTLLEHGGDFVASAKQLLKEGYGEFEPSFRSNNDLSSTTVGENGQIVDKRMNSLSKEERVLEYINEKYDIRKNLVTSKIEIKKKDEKKYRLLEDEDLNQVWFDVNADCFKYEKGKVRSLLTLRDTLEEFHPFKDYFNTLPKWDSQDHIGSVIKLITTKEGQEKRLDVLFTKWIVAVVASALEIKENHAAFVLKGAQGLGKTSFFRNLVPPELKDYYKEDQVKAHDKDAIIKTTNSFLINMDELDGVTMGEAHALKALMTSSAHDIRMPYAQFSTILKRRASFSGSVNKDRFLNDATGSRRFFIVEIEDLDYMTVPDHKQLYAQALNLLENGFQYWLDKEEIIELNMHNESYQKEMAEKDLINEYMVLVDMSEMSNDDIKKKVGNDKFFRFWSNTQIRNYFKKKHPHIETRATTLGIELSQRGGESRIIRFGKKTVRGYLIELINEENEASDF